MRMNKTLFLIFQVCVYGAFNFRNYLKYLLSIIVQLYWLNYKCPVTSNVLLSFYHKDYILIIYYFYKLAYLCAESFHLKLPVIFSRF